MPGQRLPMRQVREVLRLKHVCGHSRYQIAAMVGVSRYTVAEYLRRAAVVGITWPVPAGLDDVALERKLFPPPFTSAQAPRPQPEWSRLHAELRKPGVTLLLLWEEYRAGQPDGYGYSRFCDLHAAWRGRLPGWLRLESVAGFNRNRWLQSSECAPGFTRRLAGEQSPPHGGADRNVECVRPGTGDSLPAAIAYPIAFRTHSAQSHQLNVLFQRVPTWA